jgi:hypothetical protein
MSTQVDAVALAKKIRQNECWIREIEILNNLDAIFDVDSSFEEIKISSQLRDLQDEHIKPLLKLKKLKVLFLGSGNFVDDQIQFLAEFPLLEDITLSCCDRLSDEGFKVFGVLTLLKKVHLTNCHFTDSTLDILSKLVHLEELDMNGCRKFTNNGLQLLTSLPKLRLLNVESCSHLNDESLLVISTFPALREFRIGAPLCKEITSFGFRHLVANCQSLTNLRINQTYEIVTDETLEDYQQRYEALGKIDFAEKYESLRL